VRNNETKVVVEPLNVKEKGKSGQPQKRAPEISTHSRWHRRGGDRNCLFRRRLRGGLDQKTGGLENTQKAWFKCGREETRRRTLTERVSRPGIDTVVGETGRHGKKRDAQIIAQDLEKKKAR